MRAVVQRVAQASVTGGGRTAEIGRGLCVLVGIEVGDSSADRDAFINQLLKLRLFHASDGESEGRPWSSSVVDTNADILLVSQFTLNATLKSGKPSFHRAMRPEAAREMWGDLVEYCTRMHPRGRVESCVFGSMMHVSLVNDGPVTLCLTSTDGKCVAW